MSFELLIGLMEEALASFAQPPQEVKQPMGVHAQAMVTLPQVAQSPKLFLNSYSALRLYSEATAEDHAGGMTCTGFTERKKPVSGTGTPLTGLSEAWRSYYLRASQHAPGYQPCLGPMRAPSGDANPVARLSAGGCLHGSPPSGLRTRREVAPPLPSTFIYSRAAIVSSFLMRRILANALKRHPKIGDYLQDPGHSLSHPEHVTLDSKPS